MKRLLTLGCAMLILALCLTTVRAQVERKAMCHLLSSAGETWQGCYQRITQNLVRADVPDSTTVQYRLATFDTLLTCIGEDLTSGYLGFFNYRDKGWAILKTEGTHGLYGFFQWDESLGASMRTVIPGELHAFFFDGHPDVTILLKRTDDDVAIPSLAMFDTAQAVAYGMTRAIGKDANQAKLGWQQLRMRKVTELLHSSVADSVLQDWQRRYDLTLTVAEPLGWHQDAVLPLESTLFEDIGGLERCTIMVGNWLAFRFPGSQLVHFVYAPEAAEFAKK